MHLLELFSGTGSIGRAFEEEGWEVTSLDCDPKSGATIICDIMDWDFTRYPVGYFEAIWASPVCTMYSRARTTAKTPRDLIGSDRMVQRVLDIIKYFKPLIWAFENPQTGLLPKREVVAGMPFHTISYCSYGYQYRKYTAIWTNSKVWKPRPKCCKANPCQNMIDGRHPKTAQRLPSKVGGVRIQEDVYTQNQLYSMPPDLCKELAQAFAHEVNLELS